MGGVLLREIGLGFGSVSLKVIACGTREGIEVLERFLVVLQDAGVTPW